MMGDGKLFGTDGIRGVANSEPMTPATLVRLGEAVADFCGASSRAVRLLIGRDTRVSGAMLESALSAGMAAGGAEVLLVGEIPTPAIALLTRDAGAAAGAVISASHNPFADNGVKLFGGDGFKLPDVAEAAIEARMRSQQTARAMGARVGRLWAVQDASQRYIDFLLATQPAGFSLNRMKVVLDCAHGAAYRVGPEVLEKLGAEVTAIGVAPDGVNINEDHGALHPERLQNAVREAGAALGVALDGDADRVLLVDHAGAVVDGDEILAILVEARLRADKASCPVVVGTVMSNMGLEIALRERGVQFIRTAVGDRNVVEEMRRHGATLGAESSGHVVLLDQHTTGDGLLAALSVCRIIHESGRDLAALRQAMSKFPQVVVNVRVDRRRDPQDLPVLQEAIAQVESRLKSRGRVLVRPSGTEALVRVMVEGEDETQVRADAAEIAAAVAVAYGPPVEELR